MLSAVKHMGRIVLDRMPCEVGLAVIGLRNVLQDGSHKVGDTHAQEWLDEVDREGLCIVPGFFSREACAELRNSTDELIRKFPDALHQDSVGSDHRIFGAEQGSEVVSRKFSSVPLLMDMARAEQGDNAQLGFTLAARLDFKEKNLGSGGGWHRDSTMNQFKAIVYLSDVDEANGPFQFVLRSHKLGWMMKDNRLAGMPPNSVRMNSEQAGSILAKNPERLKECTAKQGTLILACTRGLHRGKPIEAGSRYALTNYYFHSRQLTPWMYDHFKPVLGYDVKIDGRDRF